ncbi:MAG: hypothetical protein P1V20_28500 [Verrucomicrobiales bacterium]|nr:hypothetical protein [Verrucomicrobiales bacterium]
MTTLASIRNNQLFQSANRTVKRKLCACIIFLLTALFIPIVVKGEENSLPENAPPILTELIKKFEEAKVEKILVPYRRSVQQLADSYSKAIDRGIENATFKGDLALVLALREEQKTLTKLEAFIEKSDPDSLPRLPELPPEAEPTNRKLRNTWSDMRKRYEKHYFSALNHITEMFAASLEAAEPRLTKERKFDDAEAVRQYRIKFLGIDEKAPEKELEKSQDFDPENAILAGQYQPVPTSNAFPLPKAIRPTEPCKVVAWRIDGAPVNQKDYQKKS